MPRNEPLFGTLLFLRHHIPRLRLAALGILFGIRVDMGLSVFVHPDMDGIGTAADRAVFDVGLTAAFGQVQRNDDFLTAGVAHVAGLLMGEGIAGVCRIRSKLRVFVERGQVLTGCKQSAGPVQDGQGFRVCQSMIPTDFKQDFGGQTAGSDEFFGI